MKFLSASSLIGRPAPGIFRSWRWMFLAIMLLVAATVGALYVEVAQAQGVDGAITGLTLSSDAPGTLTVSWDAASPVPTDYRIDWATSDRRVQVMDRRRRTRLSGGNRYGRHDHGPQPRHPVQGPHPCSLLHR